MKQSLFVPAGVVVLVLGACTPGERMSGPVPRGGTPRDVHALAAQRTAEDPRLPAWEEASRRALRSGLSIAPAFRERVRFPADRPHAVAYRVSLGRGERLDLAIDDLDGGGALFADVFHVIDADMFRLVHSAAGAGASVFEARATGEYVVRLQPRIGGGGLYEVTIGGSSSLLFPVIGAGLTAVGSWYGDPRDGGVRRHEGIDIFAERGTPVLAVADGYVTNARTTPVGGRVVWLSDDRRGVSYYYAHLDEHRVAEGTYVSAGDTIGTVGNTGNATGTRPHLHFGIYRPGTVALDPVPLLRNPSPASNVAGGPLGQAVSLATSYLGEWALVNGSRVRLRAAPSLGAAVVAELGAATPLFVLGGLEGWNRVITEDGTTGFISAEFTAPAAGRSAPLGR